MAMSEDQMQRALAAALSTHPAGSLQEIAKAAGIGKTTLYRFAATRERLLDVMRKEGMARVRRIFEDAHLDSAPPVQALTRLAENLLTEREFCAFLMTDYEVVQKANLSDSNPFAAEWSTHEASLERLFLRGQKDGIFRLELPASWMTDVFNSLMYTVVDAERRGRLAPANMLKWWIATFIHGCGAQDPSPACQT